MELAVASSRRVDLLLLRSAKMEAVMRSKGRGSPAARLVTNIMAARGNPS